MQPRPTCAPRHRPKAQRLVDDFRELLTSFADKGVEFVSLTDSSKLGQST